MAHSNRENSTEDLLRNFANKNDFLRKGGLAVALVVTRQAVVHGLPLRSDSMVTNGGGQVLGLGKSQVQSILKDYKIFRILAEEGGRTSRGSLGRMEAYVEFLNSLIKKEMWICMP